MIIIFSFVESSFKNGIREEYACVGPGKMTEKLFDRAYKHFRIQQERMAMSKIQKLPKDELLRSEMVLQSLSFFNLLWANEI